VTLWRRGQLSCYNVRYRSDRVIGHSLARIEKTVFVSYRRTDESWGLAIFQDLTQHGYDVFIDYDGIAGGDFATVILENIRARAHFLVLLTPTALERCGDPKDWMRREIEAALDSQRNIVPLMLAGFDFGKSATAGQLTGKLAALKEYNGLEIPKARFFSSEMERLRNRFLNVRVDAVLHPASDSAQQVAKEQQDKATMALGEAAAQHREEERRAASSAAARLIARGRWRKVAGSAIALLLVAWIGLYQIGAPVWVPWTPRPEQPGAPAANQAEALTDRTDALVNAGTAYMRNRELDNAIARFSEAIQLNPKLGIAFLNRGVAYSYKGDLDREIADYTAAIRLDPDLFYAFLNRANAYANKGDYGLAIADYSEVIRRDPKAARAFCSRGRAKLKINDTSGNGDIAKARQLDASVCR